MDLINCTAGEGRSQKCDATEAGFVGDLGLTVADPKAPLPQWSTFGSSDTAAECEQQRIYNIDRSKGLPQTPANVAVAD
jgi:hypothetical protein